MFIPASHVAGSPLRYENCCTGGRFGRLGVVTLMDLGSAAPVFEPVTSS